MEKKNPYVVVIGGTNVDICGRSFETLIPEDSNPGTVRMSLGGVGRNIAHNLSKLGISTVFITALGDDWHVPTIEKSCRELGVDLTYAVRVPGGVTSSYLFLTEPDGNMALAVCDAALISAITKQELAARLEILNGAAAVVFDGNLDAEIGAYLTEHCTAPLFADPVSVTKAGKLKNVLGGLKLLKPNRLEAEFLSGVAITDEASLYEAADRLLSTGLKQVVISLGRHGALFADRSEKVFLPCFSAEVSNVTGGGDAMMATLVWGALHQMSLPESGRYALAAASMTVSCSETNHPDLSAAALKTILKEQTSNESI